MNNPVPFPGQANATKTEDVRRVSILGSTGSVGQNTVDLLSQNPNQFQVQALVANTNAACLAEQAKLLNARLAVVADESAYEELKSHLSNTGIDTAAGDLAVEAAARLPADWIMAAIVGAAGLKPTLAALEQGTILALANKECLVCAGSVFMDAAAKSGATLLPVDSEHSAIFQARDANAGSGLARITLTASGGPFRTWTLDQMAKARPEDALKHPNWEMGSKVTIDSATMMNKGLELIEAHHLFGLGNEHIDILVHPESIVHGMVAYDDGSVIAQLGMPDMRTPIAVALAWPNRMAAGVEPLDLADISSLTFERPDSNKFEALKIAREVLDSGDRAATILNATNEVAVEAFLEGRIGFLEIARCSARQLERADLSSNNQNQSDLNSLLALDAETRHQAREDIEEGRF